MLRAEACQRVGWGGGGAFEIAQAEAGLDAHLVAPGCNAVWQAGECPPTNGHTGKRHLLPA